MLKKLLALALVAALGHTQGAAAFAASPKQSDRKTQTIDQVKATVDRAGLGEKARVTVWRRDGTKLKGFVSERRDGEFVIRDRKTNEPSIIPFAEVSRVEINRGHSTARNTAIGVAIGAGAVLTTLALLIASLDD
jgi:hypothetical protein